MQQTYLFIRILDEIPEFHEVLFLFIRCSSEVIWSSVKIETRLVSKRGKFLDHFSEVGDPAICIQILDIRRVASRRRPGDPRGDTLDVGGGPGFWIVYQCHVPLPAFYANGELRDTYPQIVKVASCLKAIPWIVFAIIQLCLDLRPSISRKQNDWVKFHFIWKFNP